MSSAQRHSSKVLECARAALACPVRMLGSDWRPHKTVSVVCSVPHGVMMTSTLRRWVVTVPTATLDSVIPRSIGSTTPEGVCTPSHAQQSTDESRSPVRPSQVCSARLIDEAQWGARRWLQEGRPSSGFGCCSQFETRNERVYHSEGLTSTTSFTFLY